MDKNKILNDVREFAEESLKPKEFIPGTTKIPASGAVLSSDDIVSLTEAVLQFWYTEYKFCAQFRKALSSIHNSEVTLCNSGSSANLLAISAALECFPRRKYIVTCATHFPTAIAPIYQNGQIPIYIDIDPLTLNPSYEEFKYVVHHYGDDISGVTLAHTLGFPFQEVKFDRLGVGFTLIDCCDALGASIYVDHLHKHTPVGYYADAETLSFFPAHQIFSGEGGAVLSYSSFKKVVDSFNSWGRDCWCEPGQSNTCGKRFKQDFDALPKNYDHKYIFSHLGYNLKMTEWQAALGLSQLKRLEEFVKIRQKNFLYLFENMPLGDELMSVSVPEWSVPSPFGFPIMVNSDRFIAQDLIDHLELSGIATRRVFAGNITKQPAYIGLPYIKVGDLSGSDKIMNDMFWIGCHPQITKPMMDYMVEKVDEFMKGIR